MRGALKLLLMPLMAFGITACDEVTFDGELLVNETMTFNDGDEAIALQPGSYDASIEMGDSLEIEFSDGNMSVDLEYKIPKDFKPPKNGSFTLSAADTGLNYDIVGESDTIVSKGEEVSGVEDCHGNYGGTGRRIVRYYQETTNSAVSINFDVMAASYTVGVFEGSGTTSRRVYTYRGSCMGGNNPPPVPPIP